MKTLPTITFRELLAGSIKDDPTIAAAADSLDAELQAVNEAVRQVLIYARIDELPEDVIDLLGWQFHVDFWDSAWPLDQKREMVRLSIAAHRRKGTPWAVESVLRVFGIEAKLIEWWEYSGDPYRFMVEVEAHGWGWIPERDSLCRKVIEEMKSLRSHLDVLRVRRRLDVEPIVIGVLPAQGGRQAIMFGCDPAPAPLSLFTGVMPVQAARQSVPVIDPGVSVAPTHNYAGCVVAATTRQQVR
ncbi:phage tail protein I [Oceanidesulfovibrio indonesiensis]|uniref:Phage tail protein I n=1 Tax=Oceanidesulfovibrio indonesiensis TaxID=54767 RepID=A0A7M3MBM5_9BACT|nr:phage tail protein I [Oceanidesulfovibrio indonesiensis]TVM15073.1 phage tail protein I [Oceanidesulfovibrio indonesiensis]